ncbi:MAG: FecR domain-containing protein, partial [Rhodoferax sp.]|nr:FecR domain-containing protein [Rhodoferax sp.]MCF8210843.1 FecR domain-containing protein [Rhodoferax sp.]
MKLSRLVLVLVTAAALPIQAQEAVGLVKTVAGDATVTDAGKAVKAQAGTPVHSGSILKTSAKGAMGVTFKDNTVMSFGPDTELVIDEFLYAPAKGNLKFGSRMTKGSLEVVSGVIAKLRPESVDIKTPTGTIGIRGTHFLVKVEAKGE